MRGATGLAIAVMSLAAGLISSASAGPLAGARTQSAIFEGKASDPYVLAVRAYVWGYPLVRAAELRQNATRPDDPLATRPATVAGAPLNRLGLARALATPETRIGVAPNNDTLYALAFLDTQAGPFVLETPDFGDRYYTFQFGQADTSTEQSFGQRTHGAKLPPLFIYGPQSRGNIPVGMIGVASRYRYLMIAGRILVNGATDLSAVHALQDQILLRTFKAYRSGIRESPAISPQRLLIDPAHPAPPDLQFLQSLGAVLRDWTPAPEDRALVNSLRSIGLSRQQGFRPERLSPSERAAIAEGLVDGEAVVRAKTFDLGRKVNGWSINYAGTQFAGDRLLRAAVAMDQIYIVEREEALYPSARVDDRGEVLDGRNSYRIRFPANGLPPVGAFWSITLYHAKGFMVENPIDRWSIGDRTPGLVYGPDGSLELLVQQERPAGPDVANWLPAPNGPFMLLMRLYIPKPAILNGAWTPPPVTKVRSDVESR
jgi:hypothetical protein